jgi:hypothetical protein
MKTAADYDMIIKGWSRCFAYNPLDDVSDLLAVGYAMAFRKQSSIGDQYIPVRTMKPMAHHELDVSSLGPRAVEMTTIGNPL